MEQELLSKSNAFVMQIYDQKKDPSTEITYPNEYTKKNKQDKKDVHFLLMKTILMHE